MRKSGNKKVNIWNSKTTEKECFWAKWMKHEINEETCFVSQIGFMSAWMGKWKWLMGFKVNFYDTTSGRKGEDENVNWALKL